MVRLVTVLLRIRKAFPLHGRDEGMVSAEYAIGTLAAAAFAALLYTVVTGDSVLAGLTSLVERAISVDF